MIPILFCSTILLFVTHNCWRAIFRLISVYFSDHLKRLNFSRAKPTTNKKVGFYIEHVIFVFPLLILCFSTYSEANNSYEKNTTKIITVRNKTFSRRQFIGFQRNIFWCEFHHYLWNFDSFGYKPIGMKKTELSINSKKVMCVMHWSVLICKLTC